MSKVGDRVRQFFTGHERSVRIKKNIATMLVLKGMSVVVSFVLVPMTLGYLNPTRYGIWLTLSSLLGWISYFDLGLGNGLRNRLAEALAAGDVPLARSYVSTTYVLIAAIISCLIAVVLCASPFVRWSAILNAPPEFDAEIQILAIAVFILFGIRFVVNLIGTILLADQRPALANSIDVVGNFLALLFVYLIVHFVPSSLLALGFAIGVSSLIAPLAISFWLFRKDYRTLAPRLHYFHKKFLKSLFSLGVKFFLLQAGALIVFSTSNILISQLFQPSEVVPYNIAFKYFSIATMLFAILLTPFWSAYTEAYVRNDVAWIRSTMRKLVWMWSLMAAGIVLMIAGAGTFYQLWVGPSVHVSLLTSIVMAAYVLEGAWCNIYVNFINGTGKVQLQLWAAGIVATLMIPLSIALAKYTSLGITGIVLAPTVLLLPWCFIWPVQVRKILSDTTTGIWNK